MPPMTPTLCAGPRTGGGEASLRTQLLEAVLGEAADGLPPDLLLQAACSLLGLAPPDQALHAPASPSRHWLDDEGAEQLNRQLQRLTRGARVS